MKSSVSSFRTSFSGKHPCRIFALALERINSCCIWEFSRNIFLQNPSQQIPPAPVTWYRNFGYLCMGQRLCMCLNGDLFVPNFKFIDRFFVFFYFLWPALQQL